MARSRMQPVKVALAEGQVTILDSGPEQGAKVVVDGAERLRPGQPVSSRQHLQGQPPRGCKSQRRPLTSQPAPQAPRTARSTQRGQSESVHPGHSFCGPSPPRC